MVLSPLLPSYELQRGISPQSFYKESFSSKGSAHGYRHSTDTCCIPIEHHFSHRLSSGSLIIRLYPFRVSQRIRPFWSSCWRNVAQAPTLITPPFGFAANSYLVGFKSDSGRYYWYIQFSSTRSIPSFGAFPTWLLFTGSLVLFQIKPLAATGYSLSTNTSFGEVAHLVVPQRTIIRNQGLAQLWVSSLVFPQISRGFLTFLGKSPRYTSILFTGFIIFLCFTPI